MDNIPMTSMPSMPCHGFLVPKEIRYWDSLRNWSSPGALKDLMDNSRDLTAGWEDGGVGRCPETKAKLVERTPISLWFMRP